MKVEIYSNTKGNTLEPGKAMPTRWVYVAYIHEGVVHVEDNDPYSQAFPIKLERIKRIEYPDRQLSLDELPPLTPGESRRRAIELINKLKGTK